MAQTNDQNFTDSLIKKFEYYTIKKQQGVLFAHFDKTIYTNNENVWFTAYLLDQVNKSKDDVLSVVMVKDDDHAIAIGEKFLMAEGISFGNLFLPDTIPPGDYSLMLYTNNVSKGKPANIFIQPVTIKNTTETSFTASLNLIDTGKYPADGKRKVLLVTEAKGAKIISGATVSYYVGNKLHPIVSGIIKTDKAGQYLFSIPVQNLTPGSNLLEAVVKYGKEVKPARLELPVYKNVPLVRFYPEGGNMAEGISNTVGWEVKNTIGNPNKVSGVLYCDGKPVDTIFTNSFGMGRFNLNPKKSSSYYVKLLLLEGRDSSYKLPSPTLDQPVLTIKNAVADDTLKMIIKSSRPEGVYVVVHNYRQVFFSFPVGVSPVGKTVKVILADVPKGLAEVTILDNLHRPVAERLFFAHYSRRVTPGIHPDKNIYKTRQQVTLNLDLHNAEGKHVTGLVSIACVQASRFEIKKATNIESYFYLNNELGPLPVKENYMGNRVPDKEYLEDVLLIKGWRRYTWPDLIRSTPTDTIRKRDSLRISGSLTEYGKVLRKNMNLIMMKDSGVVTLTTDPIGNFTISNEALLITGNKQNHLFIAGSHIENFHIALFDPYHSINHALAESYHAPNYMHTSFNYLDENTGLSGLQHVIHLKEVKIRQGKIKNEYYALGAPGANGCGDYVCKYNILNCPNHRSDPDNHEPVPGGVYAYNGNPSYRYEGCMVSAQAKHEKSVAIDGIYYPIEFYPSDYAQLNPPGPEFLSTVYWKHMYKISAGNNPAIKFYTSDITGDFKIVVQGLTENDVVYSEKIISVTKP